MFEVPNKTLKRIAMKFTRRSKYRLRYLKVYWNKFIKTILPNVKVRHESAS